MKYNVIKDGESIEVRPGSIHKISCCDCGLVHKMAVAVEDNGNIGLAFERDPRATGQRRFHLGIKRFSVFKEVIS